MPVHVRADLLRAYVERYGQDGWCRAGIGHGKMLQIAHPELGPVVQELWDRAYRGYEAREVLLELIWLTPLPDCADLALAALQDTALDIGHLTDAARCVLAVGNTDAKEMLKNMGLAHELPQPIIRYILPELFSNVLSNDEFLALIDSLEEVPGTVHGLGYAIYCAVKSVQQDAGVLRDRLVAAIWDRRTEGTHIYEAQSSSSHYVEGLFELCLSTIPPEGRADPVSGWALAVTTHFGERRGSIIARQEVKALDVALEARSDLRKAYFWAYIQLSDHLEGRETDWERFIRGTSETRRGASIVDGDQGWLLNSLRDGPETGIAYHALVYFFDVRSDQALANDIRNRIADRPDLLEHLDAIAQPTHSAVLSLPSASSQGLRRAKSPRFAKQHTLSQRLWWGTGG